jgi:C-terminal processing protease CtpA/Prc
MTKSNNTKISLSPNERVKILASIKKLVLKHHINVGGVSYDAWTTLVDQRASELLGAETGDFESGVRQLLSELGSSHTAFYHEHGKRVLPQHSISATLRGFPLAGSERWFFLDVFEGGPAHIAGIKPGDMLLAVDGTEYLPPSMPPFDVGETYRLRIADARGENTRQIAVEVPKRKGTKVRPPIVEPKSLSHAMVAPNIGLLRIMYFPGAMGLQFAKDLDAAITDLKQHGMSRLIIDLRGNIGGGLGLARLASYMCSGQIPIGHSLTPRRLRTGYRREDLPSVPMPRSKIELAWTLARFLFRDKSVVLLTQGLGPQPFHSHIVLLVNEWTNSAAEMVVGFAAENRLATIVGKQTAGNVLGASNFKVGSGYWVRLPVFGWYTSKDDCLEGKGVLPDVFVEVDPCQLNAGVDQQMIKAIEILSGMGDSDRAATPRASGDQPQSAGPARSGSSTAPTSPGQKRESSQ